MQKDQTAIETLFSEADVIYSYSRAQAVSDGDLVDLSGNDAMKQHYKYPVAATRAVWNIIERAIENPKFANSLSGILHDLAHMARINSRQISETTRLFQMIIRGAGRKSLYTFKIICGPGDSMEPVLTILMPEED
jgi:hypothetical protein